MGGGIRCDGNPLFVQPQQGDAVSLFSVLSAFLQEGFVAFPGSDEGADMVHESEGRVLRSDEPGAVSAGAFYEKRYPRHGFIVILKLYIDCSHVLPSAPTSLLD